MSEEIRSMDKVGIDFLCQEEGLRLKAYQCSAGVWTIGYGSTLYEDGQKVKRGDKITLARAKSLFKITLKHYEKTVYANTRDDITQNMFNALVSLCYNIETSAFRKSTVLKRVNANPNDSNIALAFRMWRMATVNGLKKPILLGRRNREIKLYFKP